MILKGYLDIASSTWDRETHDLFDYKSRVTLTEHFKLNSSGKIFRNNNKCFINTESEEAGSLGMLEIERKLNEFLVSLLPNSKKMWLVINKIPQSCPAYRLSQGDWLRIGRIRVKVLKISEKREDFSNLIQKLYSNNQLNEPNESAEIVNKSTCRVCLCDSESLEDPLINPCKCAGTMKFIHVNCLKNWVKSKTSQKFSEKTMSFQSKDLTCELCKGSFPLFLSYNSQKVLLVNAEIPKKPYIIIEELQPGRREKLALHVISLDPKESVQIGRGHTSDIIISDISVSRKHCKIFNIKNEFFIKDCKSKFGTLARVKKPFTIKPKLSLTIQINRTIFRMEYKVPWRLGDCCDSSKAIENFALLTQPDIRDVESEIDSSKFYLAGSSFT